MNQISYYKEEMYKLLSKCRKLEAQLAKQNPIIEEVAEVCEYETEYYGCMERYCFYCNAYLGEGGEHEAGCIHLEAKALIQEKGECPHQFHYFGEQKTRRCVKCNRLESE